MPIENVTKWASKVDGQVSLLGCGDGINGD
jgi:hypothetical protein